MLRPGMGSWERCGDLAGFPGSFLSEMRFNRVEVVEGGRAARVWLLYPIRQAVLRPGDASRDQPWAAACGAGMWVADRHTWQTTVKATPVAVWFHS